MATDDFSSKITANPLDGVASENSLLKSSLEQHTGVVEVSGAIKWFDATKGYGFISADNGLPDVLLHITCLRKDGYQSALEGAKIVVQASQGARGLQAFHVVSMDESTALHPSQLPAPRTHVFVTPTSGLDLAVVKWFNRLRGFGFVSTGEGKPDIFVHMEVMRKFGILELKPGQSVLVRYGDSENGFMAAEIRLVDGSGPPISH